MKFLFKVDKLAFFNLSTVLITGASKGIGKAAAKAFANAGWNLLLIARSDEDLKSLSMELKNERNKIFFKSIDLSNPLKISEGLTELLNNDLCPSVLINNAGVAWTGDLLSMTLITWQWIIQVNLTSIFQICSEVVPLMRKKEDW